MSVSVPTRRLGHANLFVRAGCLEESSTFYHRVVGLEEVCREPAIKVSLLSSGRTHHDIGLIEASGEERRGVDNYVQMPKGRGGKPGLNHLGWETANEAALVDAYHRAVAAGVDIHRTADHQVVHSVYVFDPDGNLNEWYADIVEDWRTILNLSRDDLITSHWQIGAKQPIAEPKYAPNAPITYVDNAIFRTKGMTQVTLVARDFDAMAAHYQEFGGLVAEVPEAGGALCRFRGQSGRADLHLVRSNGSASTGLHHVSFEMTSERDLDESLANLRDQGIEPHRLVENDYKKSVFVFDPNEILLEFLCPRSDAPRSFQERNHDVDSLAYVA